MLYSLKMRAAQGGSHEQGGKHISGAERLVNAQDLEEQVAKMLARAQNHERGRADFINIKIQEIPEAKCAVVPVLEVCGSPDLSNLARAQAYASGKLLAAGVSLPAVISGFKKLKELAGNMRGALLIDSETGAVLTASGDQRGVRVTNMDAQNQLEYLNWLQARHLQGEHAQEAIILASKVAATQGLVAELCWSDDPNYTTGYVADKKTYYRIENLKELGSDIGGRVFFVKPKANLAFIIDFLQEQAVLVSVKGANDVTRKD